MAIYRNNLRPSIRPSLNLDFAGSRSVDSRISFNRASQATSYDKNGLIQYYNADQPRIDFDSSTGDCQGLLVEESRTNLFGSDPIANGGVNIVIQPYTTDTKAPDGTFSAWKITPTTASPGQFYLDYSLSIPAQNAGTYTYSVWIKGPVGYGVAIALLYSTGGNIEPSFSFTGDWQRVSVTKTYDNTASGNIRLHPVICRANPGSSNGSVTIPSYFYMWGPQVEVGSTASSYIPPPKTFTTRSSNSTYFDSSGTLRISGTNQARYGYGYDSTSSTWVSQGLILEPAATNILVGSDLYGDTLGAEAIYTKTNSSTDVVAPNGGRLTTKVVTGTTGNTWYWKVPSAGTFSTNTTYTISVWIRTASGTTGTWNLQPYPYSGNTLCNVTDTWQRFSVTFTTDGSGTQPYVGLVSPQTNKTFYLWGWQAETGYFATSYIPTYASSATRAVDSYTMATTTRAADFTKLSVTDLYPTATQTQLSTLVDFKTTTPTTGNAGVFGFTDLGQTNWGVYSFGDGSWKTYESSVGYAITYFTSSTPNVQTKIAQTWGTGAKYYTGTGANASMNRATGKLGTLTIGYVAYDLHLNGWIRQLKIYPQAISSNEANALTS